MNSSDVRRKRNQKNQREIIKELGKRNISVFNFESEEDFVEDVSNA